MPMVPVLLSESGEMSSRGRIICKVVKGSILYDAGGLSLAFFLPANICGRLMSLFAAAEQQFKPML